jgi:PAS domain S-box-containing protein
VNQSLRSTLLAYGLPAFCVAAALLGRAAAPAALGGEVPWLLFLAAVALAAWLGGLWPGLAATGIAAVAGTLFLDPTSSRGEVTRFVLFALVGGMISALGEALHRRRGAPSRWAEATRQGDLPQPLIGDERKSEQALQDSERRLRALLSSPTQTVWRMPPGGERATLIVGEDPTGLSEDEQRDGGWLKAVHPDDRERSETAWRQALKTGTACEVRHRLRTREGSYRHFLARVVPVRDPAGNVREWIGTSTDITEQERAAEALREQAGLLALAHDAFIIRDLDGTTRQWSPGAEETYGYAAEEAVGRSTHELLKTRSHHSIEEITARLLRDGRWEGELIHARKDGRHIAVDSRWVLRRGPGERLTVLESNRDITARKKAERALRESEHRSRAIVEHAPVGISERDLEGRFTDANPRFCEITGYTRDELLGKHFAEITHPDEVAEEQRQFKSIAVGEIPSYMLEKRYVRKDGSTVWVNTVVSVVRDAEGRPRRAVGVVQDITDRKRADETLRASREELRVTLASIGDAVAVTDAQGRVVFLNNAAQDLTGWGQQEAAGRQLEEVFRIVDETTRWPAEAPVKRALRGGSGVGPTSQAVLLRRAGHEVPIEDSAAPIKGPDGKVTGAVLVFRDVTERRKTADALRERERFIGRVLDTTPEVVYVYDVAERRIIFINGQVKRTLGVTPDEVRDLRQQFFARYYHPDDRDRLRDPAARYHGAADGQILEAEYRMRHADGTWHWFANREIVFMRDPGGAPRQVLGVTADITARKRAQEAVRESEERFRLMADSAPVMIWVNGPEGCQFVNRAYTDFVGVSEGELLGAGWACFAHPEDHDAYVQAYTKAAAARAPFAAEVRFRRHDGEYRWLRSQGVPRFTPAGEYLGHVGGCVDITDRKHAEEALRAGEERLRLALDAGRTGIWDWDVRNNRMIWSERLYELFGVKPGEIGTRAEDFTKLAHPEDLGRVNEAIRRALQQREPYQLEFRVVRPDGEVRWHATSGRVLYDDAGRPVRMLGATIDITDRKRAEERFRFLAEFGATLAAAGLEHETALRAAARLVVPTLGDYCIIHLAGDDGDIRQVAEAHVDPTKEELLRQIPHVYRPLANPRSRIPEVIRTGEPDFVPEPPTEIAESFTPDPEPRRIFRALGPKSWMTVPLAARGRNLGCLSLVYSDSGRRYREDDLHFAAELARRAALAVDNARLYAEVREADRRKDEFLAVLAHELRNPLAPVRNSLEILRRAGQDPAVLGEALEVMERQLGHLIRLVDDLLDVSRITKGKIVLNKKPVELATVVRSAVEASQPLVDSKGHHLSVTLPTLPVWLDADLTRLAQVVSNLLNNSARYTPPGGRIELSADVIGGGRPDKEIHGPPDKDTRAHDDTVLGTQSPPSSTSVAGLAALPASVLPHAPAGEGRPGGEVVIRVRDNGVGIPSEMLPVVFDMFAQADRPLERSQGGLGIGLTLVKRLVEMHGGAVEARSDGPGQGSEFIVRLPALSVGEGNAPRAEAGVLWEEQPAAAAGQGKHVLIVDDNHDAADSLAAMLRLMGCGVRVAYDGPTALEMARHSPPELMVVDLAMPTVDGYEVARRARQAPELSGVVLVALTGWGQPEDRRRSADAGFDHHLTKPADPRALEAILASVGPSK